MAGDVLSQSEIDALLSAISTGEMSADDMKKRTRGARLKCMTLNEHFDSQKIKSEV